MNGFDLDLFQVLWVEDDPEVTEQYPLKAETFGLQLDAYPCWDDAKEALENNFDRWSAIILDAKCKYHRGSEDNAVVFLREALDDISTICTRKGRIIPWYVLTGGDVSEVSDSINDKRLEWDADWTERKHKKYYSKNVDNEDLYRRIQAHAKISPRFQIRAYYHEVIEQLEILNRDASRVVLDILESMHYPDSHPDFNPLLYYNQLRQILEYVYRAANKVGIIPDDCIPSSDEVNLSQCCHYLSGNEAKVLGIRYGKKGDRIVPKHIQDMMFLILNLGNINSHTSKFSEGDESRLSKYINKNVYNSRYLIYSLALQLCEIVMWMNRYILQHQNKEENIKKCTLIDYIGILEEDSGIIHVGDKFSVLLKHRELLGKKVKIRNYKENKNGKTCHQYPFFVKEENLELVE